MEEVKTISILRLHYLVYRKFIKKLLELKNELSKVAGYKISIQKSIVVYTLTMNNQK